MTNLNPPTVWTVPEPFRTIYTHAREAPAGRTLFVSGQFGVAPDGRMHEDFADQLGQAMDNIEALLKAAGLGLPAWGCRPGAAGRRQGDVLPDP